ncbi:MAG: hypothetical protein JY451_07080 [Erythrobacter sp.]|nr:MAG: hypothetical protein JY451_07080 [Erythrobacter sp.]
MRPDSIRKFDLFFLAALAVGVASALLNYDTQMGAITTQLGEAGMAEHAGTVMFATLGIGLAVNLLLWFLVSRLRIGWVKWLLLAFLIYSVLSIGVALTTVGFNLSLTGLVNVLLKAIAVFFLFQPDAREWFAAAEK